MTPTNIIEQAAYVKLQNQAIKLFRMLRTVKHPAEREMIHQMLERLCTTIGIDTPELESAASVESSQLTEFWGALEQLQSKAISYNHSISPNLVAINMNELQGLFKTAGVQFNVTAPLKRELRLSESPRFIATKPVYSGTAKKHMHCWVFEL